MNVLLLITPQCSHCASMLSIFSNLIKAGQIRELKVINLLYASELGDLYEVRSVPWFSIESFEFDEAMGEKDIRDWLSLSIDDAIIEYFSRLLRRGELKKVIRYLDKNTESFEYLVKMIPMQDLELNIRVGISAVMEELSGKNILQQNVGKLVELLNTDNPVVKADVAYYLGLSHNAGVKGVLQGLTEDADENVQEIAQESIEEIEQNT